LDVACDNVDSRSDTTTEPIRPYRIDLHGRDRTTQLAKREREGTASGTDLNDGSMTVIHESDEFVDDLLVDEEILAEFMATARVKRRHRSSAEKGRSRAA